MWNTFLQLDLTINNKELQKETGECRKQKNHVPLICCELCEDEQATVYVLQLTEWWQFDMHTNGICQVQQPDERNR